MPEFKTKEEAMKFYDKSFKKDKRMRNLLQIRKCGDCDLCCRTLPIRQDGLYEGEPDISHEDFVACKYCKDGCTIYQNRPVLCKAWNCAWRMGITDTRPKDLGGLVTLELAGWVVYVEDKITKALIQEVAKLLRKPSGIPALASFEKKIGPIACMGIHPITNKLAFKVFTAAETEEFKAAQKAGRQSRIQLH